VNYKADQNPFFTGGRIFRLFLFMLFAFQATAQLRVHYSSTNLVINAPNQFIKGDVTLTITNDSERLVDSVWFVYWPNAYQKGSRLEQELLEDQNSKLHFGKGDVKGYRNAFLGVNPRQINGLQVDGIPRLSAETKKIYLGLQPGASIELQCSLEEFLPDASLNGYGYDAYSLRLSHWLPRIANPDSFEHVTYNSRNREAWFIPATYALEASISEDAAVISNLNIENGNSVQKKTVFTSSKPEDDALILLLNKGAHLPLTVPDKEISIHFNNDFPAFNTQTSWPNITGFLEKELGWQPANTMHIVAVENKKGLQSISNCIVVEKSDRQEDLEGDIIEEIVKIYAREVLDVNPAKHPFMVEGLSNYYKHLYYNRYYPDKMLLGPFANTFVARFFDVDHYPISYQNRMLYLYMVRQGLDQPLSDPASTFPRFNREAVIKGKASMWYSYLRSYVGEKNFLRGMRRWAETSDGSPESLIAAMRYYHNRDLNWMLEDLYTTHKKLDYKLKRTENCTSVYTATIKNKGDISTPYSITGFKNGEPVLTEWYEGHRGKKTVQIHLEDYDEVRLDAAGAMPEYRQKNNGVRTSGMFKNIKPLKLQFYTSFENPNKTQIFWLPSIKYNAYDQFLLGAAFYNTNLFRKPFEYRISPDYSTGTGKLTGIGSFRFNWTPANGPFHLISFGVYGRYFHYAPDLAYTRLSPTLTFNFRKKYPRSEWIQSLRLRGVAVDRETPSNEPGVEDVTIEGPPSYQIIDLRYRAEKGSLIAPLISHADLQLAEDFVKISIDVKQRWRFSKYHLLTARLFAGHLFATQSTPVDPFFQFGVSGTRDYLFDYYFIGRSDQTGIWSQQLFVTDGGMKGQTNAFHNSMLALNVNAPLFRFVGLFGDLVWGNTADIGSEFYYDYGIYLEFVPDFLEVYFPININGNGVISQPEYYRQIRFVLNLELDAIVNRVRRGWY
jgi:hypothetical protein